MKAVIQLKSAYTPSPKGLAAKKRTSGKARLGTMHFIAGRYPANGRAVTSLKGKRIRGMGINIWHGHFWGRFLISHSGCNRVNAN